MHMICLGLGYCPGPQYPDLALLFLALPWHCCSSHATTFLSRSGQALVGVALAQSWLCFTPVLRRLWPALFVPPWYFTCQPWSHPVMSCPVLLYFFLLYLPCSGAFPIPRSSLSCAYCPLHESHHATIRGHSSLPVFPLTSTWIYPVCTYTCSVSCSILAGGWGISFCPPPQKS